MDRTIDLCCYSSETIEIDVDGKTYRGMRFFTGTGEVRQEIHFGDLLQIDPKLHRPCDAGRMRRTARVILRDLVEQWQAREIRRPLKVKPRAKPQRRRGGS